MNNLIKVGLLTMSLNAGAVIPSICNEVYEMTQYYYKINTCGDDGHLLSTREYFSDIKTLSNEVFFNRDGQKIKRYGYSTSGDFHLKEFSYTAMTRIETFYNKNSESSIKRKVEIEKSSDKRVREWKYEEGILKIVDRFSPPNTKQIIERKLVDINRIYHFSYKPISRYGDEVESFFVTDLDGEVLGRYEYEFDGDIPSILAKQFVGLELEAKLRHFAKKDRFPVAVIDSGFDLHHPTITPYLVNNHEGVLGLNVDSDGNFSENINEPVIIGGFKPYPLSHGTHVASIALDGLEDVAMYGFSGDVANPKYIDRVSQVLRERDISIVNMSWGFKELGAPFTPPVTSYAALRRLIEGNPQTLFHVAAGNNAWDLDGKLKDYPASYAYNNLLVIGSLNEDDYNWDNDENLIAAIYKNNLGSNIGRISVDIFAPGKKVNGAQLGGGMVRMSGTSMASPYAMNSTTAVMQVLPHFNTLQIKELMMKSAGYVKKSLPCVSEGFIHPKRSLRVAKLLSDDPSLTIEEAVMRARAIESDFYAGEVQKSSGEIQMIWERIDQSLIINQA